MVAEVETQLEVVPMRRRDLRQIMKLEHQVFPEPWSPAISTTVGGREA